MNKVINDEVYLTQLANAWNNIKTKNRTAKKSKNFTCNCLDPVEKEVILSLPKCVLLNILN